MNTIRTFRKGIIAGMVALLATGCSVNKDEAKGMNQLYQEQGRPVRVRDLTPTPFTVDYKFPAEFKARSQSTAYAKVSDVVRDVYVKVGDAVERDQVLLSFSLDNPSYQQALLSFKNAEASFNRIESLYRDAGVSKQEFDGVKTQYELAKEALRSVTDMVRVKAPIAGTVTQLNVRTSANVSPGTALFTISNQDGFEATFYVTADEIGDIRAGAPAIALGKSESLEGTVSEVSLAMDPIKKAFPVKAFFAGKPKTLVSGMTLDVSVEAYRNPSALVVPRKELIQSGNAWYAYVCDGDTALRREVVPGRASGLDFEILEGLNPGDRLIVDGVRELADGDKVSLVADKVDTRLSKL